MESPKAGLSELGRSVAEALSNATDPVEQVRSARARVLDHVARGGQRPSPARPRGRRVIAALAAAAAVVVAAGVLWVRRPLSFEVGGSGVSGVVGELVAAGPAESVALSFSDGSSVVLRPGGRVRVLAAAPAGARVLLESGAVDVAIAHLADETRWTFEAGPVNVLVTGTKFHLAWEPREQAFVLGTSEGSVQVSGACVGQSRSVRAGQKIALSCGPAPSTPVATEPPVPSAAADPLVTPRAPSAPPAAQPMPRASEQEKTWRELLRAGRLRDAFAMAERADFSEVVRIANQSELLALADAARFSGNLDKAELALMRLRERFPGSANATTAAFALGRLAFERRRAYGAAVRWFSTYLEEAPSGPLMGDAVGRLMEARERQGDQKGARADAQRYLQRFPEGPYASEARRILGQ